MCATDLWVWFIINTANTGKKHRRDHIGPHQSLSPARNIIMTGREMWLVYHWKSQTRTGNTKRIIITRQTNIWKILLLVINLFTELCGWYAEDRRRVQQFFASSVSLESVGIVCTQHHQHHLNWTICVKFSVQTPGAWSYSLQFENINFSV